MALTKTDLCNGALSLCGQEFITDFVTDVSEEGDQCRVLYETTRRSLLTRIPWTFAQKTATLVADGTASNSLYAYSFPLPADFLSLSNTDLDDYGDVYLLQGTKILTDASAVIMTYTADIVEVSLFPPGFYRTLEHMLASRLAYPLTKNLKLKEMLFRDYEIVLQEESNRDSMNSGHNSTYILDTFSSVRIQ